MLTALIPHRNGREASFTASPTKIHTSFLKLQLGALLTMSAVQEMLKKTLQVPSGGSVTDA